MMRTCLNVGCGGDVRASTADETWVNVDKYVVGEGIVNDDALVLGSVADGSVDFLLAQDVIEHVSHRRQEEVARTWGRKLKVGGVLEVRTPDFERQVQAWCDGVWDIHQLTRMVMAHQDHDGNYHNNLFTESKLRWLFEGVVGLVLVESVRIDMNLTNGDNSHNANILCRFVRKSA